VEYFDWTPFFISWSLAGKFPKILEDEIVGEAATDLYNQAQAMLKDVIENNRFDARAVFGLYPAQRTGADTVSVFDETGRMSRILLNTCVSNLTKSQASRIYL
jgi:5-methyltetrahydrofolate--homocysteine methyltransferase